MIQRSSAAVSTVIKKNHRKGKNRSKWPKDAELFHMRVCQILSPAKIAKRR